jgi:hypothetical protein
MKKSKASIKSWSKEYDAYITYHFTVLGSGEIEYGYQTPQDFIIVSKMPVEEFLTGSIDHRVKQYLGEDQLLQIKSFLKKKFGVQ